MQIVHLSETSKCKHWMAEAGQLSQRLEKYRFVNEVKLLLSYVLFNLFFVLCFGMVGN